MQGEKAISKEMLAKLRGEDIEADDAPTSEREIEVDETPTNDDQLNRDKALAQLEATLGNLATDATVEVPNPLSAGLDFSSDVFLEDRVDPSIERPMPELRRDPSVEERRPKLPQPDDVDIESFGKVPTRPKVESLGERKPKTPPPAPFTSPKEQLEIEEEILEHALDGLDFSLRDPRAGMADPSLIMDLEEVLTEEEIELARSVVTGEREVRATPRLQSVEHQNKVEVSEELRVSVPTRIPQVTPPPMPVEGQPRYDEQPRVRPPRFPDQQESGPATAAPPHPARIGSRLTGAAAMLAFSGAAALALSASFTAVGGWIAILAAGVVALGAVRKDLGWKHELLHVIAAGAAVAATQPWALDLAQISQVSFWRAPAAMACVGALVVGLTLGLLAFERAAPEHSDQG